MENCSVSFHESEMANATTDYKPLLVQKVVAVIMCALFIIEFFMDYAVFILFDFELAHKITEIMPIVFEITFALCLGVLIKFANNKATRIALAIGVAVWMFWDLRYFLHYCHIDIPDSIDGMIDFLPGFALIYLYSLIIRNNTLSAKNRMWINTLAVLTVVSILPFFYIFFTVKKVMGDGYDYDFTLTHGLIYLTRVFMSAAAYWHFARCEAFSGKYDASAKCNYSPLNKWMAMAVIAPTIMFLCIFLLYKNYELFI